MSKETFRTFEVVNYLKTETDVTAYAEVVRAATIEECARVADTYVNEPIAKAIRALKEGENNADLA